MAETNSQTLQRIRCVAQTCDMSDVNGDPDFEASDYILDKSNNFFLSTPNSAIPGFPLGYVESTFFSGSQTPTSFLAPDGDSWRLHSATKQIGGTPTTIVVGYAEKASWKIDLPTDRTAIDAALHQQLDRIAGALRPTGSGLEFVGSAHPRIAIDGYVVLNNVTNEVLYSAYSIASIFPAHSTPPGTGHHSSPIWLAPICRSRRFQRSSLGGQYQRGRRSAIAFGTWGRDHRRRVRGRLLGRDDISAQVLSAYT